MGQLYDCFSTGPKLKIMQEGLKAEADNAQLPSECQLA